MAFLHHEKQCKQRQAFFVMISRSSSIPHACPKHFLDTYSLISTMWCACGPRTMWETTEEEHDPHARVFHQHCSTHLCAKASNKSLIASLSQHSNSPQVQLFDLIAMNSIPNDCCNIYKLQMVHSGTKTEWNHWSVFDSTSNNYNSGSFK